MAGGVETSASSPLCISFLKRSACPLAGGKVYDEKSTKRPSLEMATEVGALLNGDRSVPPSGYWPTSQGVSTAAAGWPLPSDEASVSSPVSISVTYTSQHKRSVQSMFRRSRRSGSYETKATKRPSALIAARLLSLIF